MRTAGFMLLGTVPTILAAYVLVAGYVLNKVRPVPLTVFPELEPSPLIASVPPIYRRSSSSEPETPREPVSV